MPRKRLIATVLLAIAAIIAAWLWSRPLRSPTRVRAPAAAESPVPQRAVLAQDEAKSQAEAKAHAADAAARQRRRGADRARRDALRAQIAHALEQAPAPEAQTAVPAGRTQRAATKANDSRDAPGTLVDRVGGREELVRYLNHDFMPLARECIAQAREEEPELAGMLALGVEVIADPQHGGVIERAVAAANNGVQHAGLLDCIAQTALTVTFPPPLVAGREQFELTLRVTPLGDAGAP